MTIGSHSPYGQMRKIFLRCRKNCRMLHDITHICAHYNILNKSSHFIFYLHLFSITTTTNRHAHCMSCLVRLYSSLQIPKFLHITLLQDFLQSLVFPFQFFILFFQNCHLLPQDFQLPVHSLIQNVFS